MEELQETHFGTVKGYRQNYFSGKDSEEFAKSAVFGGGISIKSNVYRNARIIARHDGLRFLNTKDDLYLLWGAIVSLRDSKQTVKNRFSNPEHFISLIANTEEQLKGVTRRLSLPLEKRVAQR